MTKKFDDNFRRLDIMHERDSHTDRRTDGQTPGHSKVRAYSQRRAVKKIRSQTTQRCYNVQMNIILQ